MQDPQASGITDNCATTDTVTNGECTVVINHNSDEVFTASASITHTVNSIEITWETGTSANIAAGGSGDATKGYETDLVDYRSRQHSPRWMMTWMGGSTCPATARPRTP